MQGFSDKVAFIWSVADVLRGDYRASEYGRVILPFLVLRRLDQVLGATRDAVRAVAEQAEGLPKDLRHQMLLAAAGESFYNTSAYDFAELVADSDGIAANLRHYVNGFSPNVVDIMQSFRFETQITRLDKADLLFVVVQRFAAVDLHPYRRDLTGAVTTDEHGEPQPNVTQHDMGYIFEELIRKFSEQSNETAGEHFTPREVIALMVELLLAGDADAQTPGAVRTIYDPACGTGGMLSVAEDHLGRLNPTATTKVYGQELNPESYAICKADMLIKGQQADNIKQGNSFSSDGLPDLEAHYLISNPPFGVDWSKVRDPVVDEHETRGHAGRFGPGLPRKNDGSLLFLLHMLSKMKRPESGGSRLAIVFNGSPLFTGAAGSGESEIRRHVITHDMLEAIIALPDQMFYNTGISTYIWVLSNRKAPHRKGKVQLINGAERYAKMRKSLGDKRKELSPAHIAELVEAYRAFEPGPDVQILPNDDFGFRRITVERPLRLDFCASEERIARLPDERAWQNLAKSRKKGAAKQKEIEAGVAMQDAIDAVLRGMDDTVHLARPPFVKALKAALGAADVKPPAPVLRAVLSALSERNPEAAVCMKKGAPEPDPDLRDYENVPMGEAIGAYLEREVTPYAPDAWVDESRTKVGYEIPFTRYFYVYEPPRPLEVIDAELRATVTRIEGLLAGVLG